MKSPTSEQAPVAPVSTEEPVANLAAVTAASRLGSSIYEKIVRIILAVAIVAVPLVYAPWTTGAIELNKQLLLVLCAAAGMMVWLLGVVVTGKLTVRWSQLDWGVLAMFAATGLAVAFSMTKLKSLFGLSTSLSSAFLTITALTVLYFLAVNVVHDRGRLLRFLLLVSASIALLFGILQMFAVYLLPFAIAHSRAFNTIGSLNGLGVLGAILLPLFLRSVYRVAGKKYLNISLLGAALALAVLVILNWWVLWTIALAGMIAMTAFDSLLAGTRKGTTLARFIGPMVIIVLGVFLLIVRFSPGIRADFPVEVAPSLRLSWDVAASVLKENLLFGYGPENFSLAFDKFGAKELANTTLSNLKFYDGINEVLTLVVHGGLVTLLAFLCLLWCVIRAIAHLRPVLVDEGVTGAPGIVGVFASLVAGIVALFLYPFGIVLTFVLYVLLALAAIALSGKTSHVLNIEEKPALSLIASLGFILGLILVLTGVYFSSSVYLADAAFAKVGEQSTPTAALDQLQKALNWSSTNDRYLRSASQLALDQLRVEVSQRADPADTQRSARIQNLITSAVQIAQRATQIAPDESLNWSNLGDVYQALVGVVDNTEKLAEDAYAKAGELRPGDPSFQNKIGAMWLARADLIRNLARNGGANAKVLNEQADQSLTKAEEAFKKAIDQAGSFGLAIYNLGAVYDRQGRVKEAIQQIERIAPFNTNEPTLMFELGLLYLRDGRKDDAFLAFQRAVFLSPQYANARWYLALLNEERGDVSQAIQQLEAIREANPDNDMVKEKLAQLRAGQVAIPPAKVVDQKPIR